MKINGTITEREKKLLSVLYNDGKARQAQFLHQTERFFDLEVTRKSKREFDLEIKGRCEMIRTKADRYGIGQKDGTTKWIHQPVGQKTEHGFAAWMPLATIREYGDWGEWVMDWSMIRDDEEENQWEMFVTTLKTKKLI